MDAHARHPRAGCQDARGVLHCAAFSAGNHGAIRQEDGMTVKPDRWIRRMAIEHKMIEPFEDRQVGEGVISYGGSSYGHHPRRPAAVRTFTNFHSTHLFS